MRRILMTALFPAALAVPAARADQYSVPGADANANNANKDSSYLDDMYSTDDNSVKPDDALAKQNETLNSQNTQSQEVTKTQETKTKTQEAGRTGDETLQVSQQHAEDLGERTLSTEVFGIKPQFGVLDYKTLAGNTETRAAIGTTFEWNLANSMGSHATRWYVGPVTGIFYSHIGSNGANYVGSGSAAGGSSNLWQFPLNLKIGYAFSDGFRISARGGGNVIYRTAVESVAVGTTLTTVSGSAWNVYPNVGADFEFAIGKTVALMLRPDFTLTPGNNLFTGTVGIAFPVG